MPTGLFLIFTQNVSMRTRFENEAQGNSEIEFLTHFFKTFIVIVILILVIVNPKYRSYTQVNPTYASNDFGDFQSVGFFYHLRSRKT